MKKPGQAVAQLSPNAHGWTLHHGGSVRELQNLEEAAAAIPASAPIHLALPCQTALLERLILPATNRDELAGMAQLQLEKTLPYPVEEAASEIEIIRQGENETTVLSIAVHTEALDHLCEPLRANQRLPKKITVFAQHFAAICPAGETVLGVWSEQEHLTAAIYEDKKLSWAHSLPGGDAETIVNELPGLLLGAEMEGVPTGFARVMLARECGQYREALQTALGHPVEIVGNDQPLPEPSANLLPPSWAEESSRAERGERVRQQLMLLAMIYVMALAGAFVYLGVMKHRAQAFDTQIAAIQPQITAAQAIQTRWETLAPAFEKDRFAEEVMNQIQKCRPSDDLHITLLETKPNGFKVDAEAPEAKLMVAFIDNLHKAEGLSIYQITASSPKYIKGSGVQFSVFGTIK